MKRDEFVLFFQPYAKAATKGTSINVKVVIAAAAVESRNGSSVLAKTYNNYFGIKATQKGWKGATVVLDTKEEINGKMITVKGKFRVYASPLDSAKDYVKFLTTNPRYKEALKYKDNPREQIKEIARAGYATASNYGNVLANVAEGIKIQTKESKGLAVAAALAVIIFLANGKN